MALLYNPVTGEEIHETRSMADIRAKTQASIAGGTTPDYEAYVKSDPNLKAYVAEHGLGTSATLADWGKWHWGGHGKQEHMTGGRASSPYRAYGQEAPAPDPAPAPAPAPAPGAEEEIDYGQDTKFQGGDNPIVVDDPSVQTTDMASLTDEMRLSKKIQELINTNNPLFKAATTKAMQAMAKRGLVNSSIAQGEVMNSIMAVALPIAQAEVKALTENLYFNKDWTNKQKMQANEAAYNKMLTSLQGQLNYTLQQFIEKSRFGLQKLLGQQKMGLQELVGQQQMSLEDKIQKGRMALQTLTGQQTMTLQTLLGEQNITLQNLMQDGKMALQHLSGQQRMDLQDKLGEQGIDLQTLIGEQQLTIEQQRISAEAWSKYGDWVTKMATTEGADQEAWQNMLNLLKGAKGWPKLFGNA